MSEEIPQAGDTDPLDEIFSFIKRTRDEVQLKMHLGQADARDEFEKLESQWKEVEKRAEPLTGAVQEAVETGTEQAKQVTGAALDVATRELKKGYERLRKMLES